MEGFFRIVSLIEDVSEMVAVSLMSLSVAVAVSLMSLSVAVAVSLMSLSVAVAVSLMSVVRVLYEMQVALFFDAGWRAVGGGRKSAILRG